MAHQFELKHIGVDGIAGALDKAERYRLLNQPEEAESICQDILAIDPDHQETLRVLVLALTDQFGSSQVHGSVRDARRYADRLTDEYDRSYYTGIVFEREARAFLGRAGIVRSAAYDGLRQAMEWFERAEALRPAGNVDALLRWNACVRMIQRERLEPEPEQREQPLE